MLDLGWTCIQLLFISSKYQRKHHLTIIFCIYASLLIPSQILGDRTAFINIETDESKDEQGSLGSSSVDIQQKVNLKGIYTSSGSIQNAEGNLQSLPADECGADDDEFLKIKPHNWIALFHYEYKEGTYTHNNGTNCQTVLDRVKKAMMFGASAIIILALNPKIVKELDIAQIFSRPVILIHSAENVTLMLNIIFSHIRAGAKIGYNTTYFELQKIITFTPWARSCNKASLVDWEGVMCMGNDHYNDSKRLKTVTMWSSCGRAYPGSGVVCSYQDKLSMKVDPGQFWNYFYSCVFVILLLLMLKTQRGENDGQDGVENIEQTLRRIAYQSLSVMKVKKYKSPETINHNDSERDTCAVCLDIFYPKQKIRVLPCFHEFHTKCVDPWLVRNRTCPLCKLNIIDQHIKSLAQ